MRKRATKNRKLTSDFGLRSVTTTMNEKSNAMNYEEPDYTDAQLLRMNAEKLLKAKQQEATDHATELDEKRLLHELSVHQIELEMQNEELRRANEKAETALRKYTMLYDFSPMGYFTLDAEGKIEDLNFSGADMLGERRFSLVGSNFKLFVSRESKAVFDTFLDKVYTSNHKESCEVTLGYYNNPQTLVYIEGVVTGENRNCLLSIVDVSGFNK